MFQQRYRQMSQHLRHAVLGGVALILVLATGATADAASRYRLNRAGSCNAVRDQLVEQIVDQLMNRRHHYHRHWRGRRVPLPSGAPMKRASRSAPSAEASMDSAKSGGGSLGSLGPSHFTGTNNQVVGVDEADKVKTDGRYIYTVHGNEVLIIKSWPANATNIVARYKMTSGTPTQLFLNGNKLVVFSSTYSRVPLRKQWGKARIYRPSFSAARATILDISSRVEPKLIAHVDIEGRLLRARMIGADVYMVTNNQLRLPSSFWSEVNQAAVKQPQHQAGNNRPYRSYYPGYVYQPVNRRVMLRRAVRRALGKVATSQLLPAINFSYGTGHQASQRPLLGCSDLYFPAGKQTSMGLISLSHLSLNGGRINASAVVGSGMKVYASQGAMYIAANTGRWSTGEYGTQIHKFDLQRYKGAPRYAASGVVPGYLLNQFSMDEHRGYLRVATTDQGWRRSWSWRGRRVNAPASNLFVLRQRQGELSIAGQVRGLAPGERIYAARMVGDAAYLVTFRKVDPLYTIDLRNPRSPKVMGELKIPGFSSYIHPIGNGQLLTVGQNADESGRVKGAHLQIFDVTDLRKPRRTHHYELTLGSNSSRSAAQWDHHAFTFNARTKTLALPLTVHRYHKEGGNFAGVILVKVDPRTGFRNLGDVEHSDLAARTRCAQSSSYCNGPAGRFWNAPVQRSIFMDDKLYTLSNYGLKVNQLPRMNAVASVLFARQANHAFLR